MGQANMRGTFEQRLHEAYDRKDAQVANIEALTNIENESVEYRDKVIATVVKRSLDKFSQSSNPLVRIDFSLLAHHLAYLQPPASVNAASTRL